jgi:membrane protease YdiL (CAAX protease family)
VSEQHVPEHTRTVDRVHVPTILQRVVGPALVEKVPRNHLQSDEAFRRRRIVSVITLVIGTTLLGFSLATAPGSTLFYPLTGAVAVVWVVGGFASGPLHLGYIPFREQLRRPIITPLALGLGSGAVFVLGALVVRQIGPLRDFVAHVLEHATEGNLALVAALALLNGAAEEVFFRGALFAAIGVRHPVLITTVIYCLVTIATGNPMLVFAAVLMGTLFALQRRASGGILGPIITHVVWSAILVFALPPLFPT